MLGQVDDALQKTRVLAMQHEEEREMVKDRELEREQLRKSEREREQEREREWEREQERVRMLELERRRERDKQEKRERVHATEREEQSRREKAQETAEKARERERQQERAVTLKEVTGLRRELEEKEKQLRHARAAEEERQSAMLQVLGEAKEKQSAQDRSQERTGLLVRAEVKNMQRQLHVCQEEMGVLQSVLGRERDRARATEAAQKARSARAMVCISRLVFRFDSWRRRLCLRVVSSWKEQTTDNQTKGEKESLGVSILLLRVMYAWKMQATSIRVARLEERHIDLVVLHKANVHAQAGRGRHAYIACIHKRSLACIHTRQNVTAVARGLSALAWRRSRLALKVL